MRVVLWLLFVWPPAEAVVDVEGGGKREAVGRPSRGVTPNKELAEVRAVLEAYLAHRRTLNHFRCRYRVYGVQVSRGEAEAFERDGKLPPEDRWKLQADCLWVCQPDSILAVTQLIAGRATQTTESKLTDTNQAKRLDAETLPAGWLLQSVSGGQYVAKAMGTKGATVYRWGDPALGPVESLLGPTPHAPPTSMAAMGIGEENNPILKHMLPNLRLHPDWFRWLGGRVVADFQCVGVQYAPTPEDRTLGANASGQQVCMRYWFARDAGYLPVLEEYTHSNGRIVARMLDVRRVSEARWFPFLAANLAWNPGHPTSRPDIAIIRVDEFEWGYEASDEEMAMRLDRDAQLEVEIDGELRWYPYGRGKLSGRELPELVKAMEEGRWPTLADVLPERAAPKRQAWLIVLGGLVLVVVVALLTRRMMCRASA